MIQTDKVVQTDKIDKTDPLHPDKKPIEHRPSWVHDATKYKFEYIHWDEAAVARFEGRTFTKTSHSSVEQARGPDVDPHPQQVIVPKGTSPPQSSSQVSTSST